jgi:hypothetical protein
LADHSGVRAACAKVAESRPRIDGFSVGLPCGSGIDGERLSGLMLAAEKGGWGLLALDAPVDTTTPQGAAMAQVLAVFAELERRLIGERTKAALAVKQVATGRPSPVN